MRILKQHKLFAVSAAGIILVSLGSAHIVPLYDGVGFPDEPYRYVKAPVGTQNASLPPSPAQLSVRLANGTNQTDFTLASKEQGPQVSTYIYSLALSSGNNATKVLIKLEPKAPDTIKPKIGTIAGNIYSFSAAADQGNVTLKSTAHESRGYVDIRSPQKDGANAAMVYRRSANSGWQKIDTTKVGNDVYEANVQGFGDYALVPVKTTSSSRDYKIPALIIMAGLVIILSAVLLALRRQNKKSKKHK